MLQLSRRIDEISNLNRIDDTSGGRSQIVEILNENPCFGVGENKFHLMDIFTEFLDHVNDFFQNIAANICYTIGFTVARGIFVSI